MGCDTKGSQRTNTSQSTKSVRRYEYIYIANLSQMFTLPPTIRVSGAAPFKLHDHSMHPDQATTTKQPYFHLQYAGVNLLIAG